MDSEIKAVEPRLKSFTGQLQTECGILERLVYKHKNQHRRFSHFQYILKLRRDLKLLISANLEDALDSSFLVINGDRPKQKVQLLEGLKRRKCNIGKYNVLERLLGFTRLLPQMVEPLLKAAIDMHTSCLVIFHEVLSGRSSCARTYSCTGSTNASRCCCFVQHCFFSFSKGAKYKIKRRRT